MSKKLALTCACVLQSPVIPVAVVTRITTANF